MTNKKAVQKNKSKEKYSTIKMKEIKDKIVNFLYSGTKNMPLDNNKKVKKDNNDNKNEQIIIRKILIIFLSFLLGLILVFLSIRLNINTNLRYYQTSKLDYTVSLKPNDYYDKRILNKNMQYIASLINSINVNFSYDFKTSDKLNYKYDYYVDSVIKVSDESTKNVIFSKTEKILDNKTESLKNSDNFKINKYIRIDYDKYNAMVKKFKSQYAISAKSELIVTLYVKIMDEEGNELKKLNADNKMQITIPLSEQMIEIKMDYKEINNSDTLITQTTVKIANYIFFILGIISFIVGLVEIVRLILFISVIRVKKTIYEKELFKILREYDRVIVEIENNFTIDNDMKIIEVTNFEELLDARDNLDKPIIFKETQKGKKSIFIVKDNNEVYGYILSLSDLEKAIKK